MVRVIVAVLVTPPPVPVMVMVRVPAFAVGATLMLTVACPEPGAGMVAGVIFTLTPLPSPDAVRAIAESKPPETVVMTLALPVPPGATVTVFGAAARVKVPVFAPTVTATAAEGIPLAITYNVLAPVAIVAGTSKLVETTSLPVATAIVLGLWVLA